MNRTILVAAVATSVAIVVVASLHAVTPAPSAPGALAPAVVAARPPPRASPPAPSLPRSPSRPTPADRPAVADAAADPPAARGADPDPLPAPSTDELRDGLAAAFWQEPVASADGVALARELDRQIPALLPPGSMLRDVECRDSLCRIETVHVDVGEFHQFVQRAFLAPTRIASNGFFASVVDEPVAGQPITTVAFLARPGSAMPGPEAFAP